MTIYIVGWHAAEEDFKDAVQIDSVWTNEESARRRFCEVHYLSADLWGGYPIWEEFEIGVPAGESLEQHAEEWGVDTTKRDYKLADIYQCYFNFQSLRAAEIRSSFVNPKASRDSDCSQQP